jgi:hypothetical protein
MAIEIVDLPINSMVIFHSFLLTFTRPGTHLIKIIINHYQLALNTMKTIINHWSILSQY